MATYTGRDAVTKALRKLGVLGRIQTPSATQAEDGLDALNGMLDRWATERLTLYSQARNVLALQASKATYTLGASGDWNIARPLWIDSAARLTADGFEIPITVFTRTQWALVPAKTLTSSLPEGVHVNLTFPLATADVWPVPLDASVSVVLYTPSVGLASVPTLDTVLSLAPGWKTALETNLALEMAPESGIVPDDTLVGLALACKRAIKTTNILGADAMILDPFLTRQGHGALRRSEFDSGTF